ncbi:MAG: L-threonylcarbamoyladenylate synthase [Candidatus Micrarchaeota archaeon]
MQLTTIPPNGPAVLLSLAHLKSGGVVCYPTDTLYGIGGDAQNIDAVKKIFDIKGGGKGRPFSVLFADWETALEYVKIEIDVGEELKKITPGPYTFLFPAKKPLPAAPGELLGCRVPDNRFCLELAKKFKKPIISTSANLHRGRPPASIEEVDVKVSGKVDLVIDGGICKYGEGSTIIDVGNRKILRKGAGLEKAREWLEKLDV